MKKVAVAVVLIAGFLVLSGIWHKKVFNSASNQVSETVISASLSQNMPVPAVNNGQNDLKFFRYTIKKGDKLTKIAERYDTSIKEILSANSGNKYIRNENLLWVGGEINIPSLYPAKEVLETLNAKNKEITKLSEEIIVLKAANNSLTTKNTFYIIVLIFLVLAMIGLAYALKPSPSSKEPTLVKNTAHESIFKTQNDAKTDKPDPPAYQEFIPGKKFTFQSRDNGTIHDGYEITETQITLEGKPNVVKVKCLKCGALDVKPDNSNLNSHYWKCSLKENVDRA